MKILIHKILIQISLALATFLATSLAHAACTAPAGNEGDLRYDGGQLKYCLGSNTWRTVNGVNKTGACTDGAIQLNGTQLQFCRGSVWKHVAGEVEPNPGSRGSDASNNCLAGNAGEFYYDTGRDFYVYCDGTDWHDFW